MIQSHAIDIDGRFVGAAVRSDDGFRFVALDIRLDEMDGRVWPTVAEMRWHLGQVAASERPARRLRTVTGCGCH